MIIDDFIKPPIFYRDMFFDASAVNILEKNCSYLDQMAYRREPVFDSLPRKGQPSSAYHHNTPDVEGSGWLLWRGSIQFRVGYTTLSIFGRTQGSVSGTARVLVYINNVLKVTITPIIGNWNQSIPLTGQGYTEGQILVIEIKTTGIPKIDQTSEWWITYVKATPSYFSPVLIDPTLPIIGNQPPVTNINEGRPWINMLSFNGIYREDLINIISNNQLHIYDRINQVPLVGFRSYLNAIMTHKAEDWEVWTGNVCHFTSAEAYRLSGSLTLMTGGSDTIRVYMNDVLVYTIGPFTTIGTHTFNVLIPFTLSAPSTNRVKLVYNSTQLRLTSQNSRLDILVHRTDPLNNGFPVLTPPLELTGGVNILSSSLDSVLNRIIFMMNAIKTRVDNSKSFTSVRAYRDNFGYYDSARRKLDREHPYTFQRRGSKLVVSGKNVKFGFGGRIYELDEDNNNTYKYKFANEQNLIEGEKYDTKTIYLDSINGLYPGTFYYLLGDVAYASEFHK